MEIPATVVDEEVELPLLLCREVVFCNNSVENQYYAVGDNPLKADGGSGGINEVRLLSLLSKR